MPLTHLRNHSLTRKPPPHCTVNGNTTVSPVVLHRNCDFMMISLMLISLHPTSNQSRAPPSIALNMILTMMIATTMIARVARMISVTMIAVSPWQLYSITSRQIMRTCKRQVDQISPPEDTLDPEETNLGDYTPDYEDLLDEYWRIFFGCHQMIGKYILWGSSRFRQSIMVFFMITLSHVHHHKNRTWQFSRPIPSCLY